MTQAYKDRIREVVAEKLATYQDHAKAIYERPEVCNTEYFASDLLAKQLRQEGFELVAISGSPKFLVEFPAPREVDREIYKRTEVYEAIDKALFSAPLEVDRYLYPYLVCKPITSTRYNLLETKTSISYFERVFTSKEQTIILLYLNFICI